MIMSEQVVPDLLFCSFTELSSVGMFETGAFYCV